MIINRSDGGHAPGLAMPVNIQADAQSSRASSRYNALFHAKKTP